MHWLSDRLAPRLEYISRFCSQLIATLEMKKVLSKENWARETTVHSSTLNWLTSNSRLSWWLNIPGQLLDTIEHTQLNLQNKNP